MFVTLSLEKPQAEFFHTTLSFKNHFFIFPANVARFFQRLFGARFAHFLGDAKVRFVDSRILLAFHVKENVTESRIVFFSIFLYFVGFDVAFMSGGIITLTNVAPQIRTVMFRSFSQKQSIDNSIALVAFVVLPTYRAEP